MKAGEKLAWFVLWLLVSVPQAGQVTAQIPDFGFPPTISFEEVETWVEGAPQEHPRLLASADELSALRRSTVGNPLAASLAKAVVRNAIALEEIPPITRELTGRRLLGQSRRCVERVLTLATAFHLTGDARHARRCEQEMLAVAAFQDWNPTHFLDVAEMTFALAIGYDWLYAQFALGDGRVKLRSNDASLELAVLAPTSAVWQLVDTEQPRNPWDSPNTDTRMVAFEAVAPVSGQLTLAVTATPGSCADSLSNTLKLRPLDEWSSP